MSERPGRISRYVWPLVFFALTMGLYWFVWLWSSLRESPIPRRRLAALKIDIGASFALYLVYLVTVVAWLVNSPAGTFDAWLDNATGATVYGDGRIYVAVLAANVLFCTVHAIALLRVVDALPTVGGIRAPAAWTTIGFNAILATENFPVLGSRVAWVGALLGIWWFVRVQSIFLRAARQDA